MLVYVPLYSVCCGAYYERKTRRYNGVAMDINSFNPPVGPMEFSAGRMHFQIGNEFVQVGWTVSKFI